MIFLHIFLSILINIGLFFIYRKNTNAVLKYQVFIKTKKKKFSCIRPSLSKKKSHHIFIQQKFKKYILAYILALITGLLKSQELGQYFKKTPKKAFYFLLISGIMNLYVKHTPDIKKVVIFI
jgi:hypothetical protein